MQTTGSHYVTLSLSLSMTTSTYVVGQVWKQRGILVHAVIKGDVPLSDSDLIEDVDTLASRTPASMHTVTHQGLKLTHEGTRDRSAPKYSWKVQNTPKVSNYPMIILHKFHFQYTFREPPGHI